MKLFNALNINLEKQTLVACSGGVDSMVALHYYNKKIKDFKALFIYYSKDDDNAFLKIKEFTFQNNIPLLVHYATNFPKSNKEKVWRDERYKIFHSYSDYQVITAHHLDDQVENYVATCLKPPVKLIPYKNKNVIRPFLFLKKEELIAYAKKYNINYDTDLTNFDGSNQRSIIRTQILPVAFTINPGLYKTVKKLMLNNSYVGI